MICWHCHWGWPKAVYDIYKWCVEAAGESATEYGPAHVVWADENWHSAEWCLEHFDEWVREHNAGRFDESALEMVRTSLRELVAIPMAQRDLCPPEYDEEHPERYPPPHGVVLVKDGAEYTVWRPSEVEE